MISHQIHKHPIIKFIQNRISTVFAILSLISIFIYFFITCIYPISESTRFFIQLSTSRVFLLLWSACIIIWSVKFLNKIFILPIGSAFNLSVFRILFFGFFAIGGVFFFDKLANIVYPWAEVPTPNRQPPPGLAWVSDILPINLTTIKIALFLFVVSTWSALIGFKTKFSISVFALSALYIFGVPNLFGKTNHNHHIFWIPAILAFSACGEALSIDSKFLKKTSSTSGQSYLLPFHILWLFMGLTYFFPGFWKIWDCGFDWVFTDNIKNHMYLKWVETDNWTPIFNVHHHPVLYKTGALFVVLFELAFITLVFNPKTRVVAFISGIIFHISTLVFMKIFFIVLVLAYISMINWEKVIRWPVIRENKAFYAKTAKANKGLITIGIILFIGFMATGISKINSWPFSCYPTFSYLVDDFTYKLSFEEKKANGYTQQLNNQLLINKYSPERFRYWENEIATLHNKGLNDEKKQRIDALTDLWELNDFVSNRDSVVVYLNLIPIVPGKSDKILKSIILK